MTIAIAGPPNAGKTSLFNRLTGASQHVGNWPGQTVARHEGRFAINGTTFDLVDLPGTYGLVAVSAEEAIASSFLLHEDPELVITVVDASNLSGGLHLVAQIAEAGHRQVVCLNMSDVAERRGISVDADALATAIGAPVISTVARRGEGVDEVKEAAAAAAGAAARPIVIDYGPIVEREISRIVASIVDDPTLASASPRWLAIQAIAEDDATLRFLAATAGGRTIADLAASARTAIAQATGYDAAIVLAERRHAWTTRMADAMTDAAAPEITWSDRADIVLTHRWLGLPAFLAVMWVVLRVTADVSAPYLDWIDATIAGPVAGWAASGLGAIGLGGGWVESMVVDGILAGVGGVLVFVPVLFALYLMLAVLEDSGYMARAAAVMDRTMRAIGIPGKAFLPMMVGFGCTVPAIYATRTLDSSRDRLLTGLLTPFMSCGARLPVYVLLAGVFFAGRESTVVFAMYLLGIGVAAVVGAVLSRTALRESEPSQFLMVMPEFRLPNARTVWSLVRLRTWEFIKGAGTVILVASMAVWLLLAIPLGGGGFADTDVDDSLFGGVSQAVSPVMEPLGFGEWEQTGALLTGFVAKEVVVSTMAQLYSVEDSDDGNDDAGFLDDLGSIGSGFVDATVDTLRAVPGVIGIDFLDLEDESSTALQDAIRESFETSSNGRGALAGLAFLVFVLLYTPCMAAVAAFRQEFGTRWMWVSVIGQFVIAWAGAFAVFQGGQLLGFG